ncbi:hypothetical protein [Streptomyces sp. CA-111067]|uniref:hypothetical protein n=1 Tax=Streptomyces sp. CA-111067 TaxID=3240046 RepID=UPI003D958C5D
MRQFLTYRRVRTELWSGAQWGEETGRVAGEFPRGYEVYDPDALAAFIAHQLARESAAPSVPPGPGSGGRPR